MNKPWKDLENYVQAIASVLWHKTPKPERIAGVNFDSVIRVADDEIVLIEITQQFTVEKVRGDISKILPAKFNMMAEGVMVRPYIILEKEPTPGMVEIGRESKVQVLSIESFAKEAFAYSDYVLLRNKHAFGSAINPTTGESDKNEYVDVIYRGNNGKSDLTIAEIGRKLMATSNNPAFA